MTTTSSFHMPGVPVYQISFAERKTMVGGVLFGPVAPIAMALVEDRLPEEPCSFCGGAAVVGTEGSACGETFAAPTADGTEIFAELNTVKRSPSL